MEEALHDVPAFRDFAGLSHWDEHIPSESSILRFRHLLERHKLFALGNLWMARHKLMACMGQVRVQEV